MKTLSDEVREMGGALPYTLRTGVYELANRVQALEEEHELLKASVGAPWYRAVAIPIPAVGILSVVFRWAGIVRKALQEERAACAALARSIGETWRDLGDSKVNVNVTPMEGFAANMACQEVAETILNRKV